MSYYSCLDCDADHIPDSEIAQTNQTPEMQPEAQPSQNAAGQSSQPEISNQVLLQLIQTLTANSTALATSLPQAIGSVVQQALQANNQNQQNQGPSSSTPRPPRLEFEYTGDPKQKPPNEWIQRAEAQFRAHGLPEDRWVVSAVPFLAGTAFNWYVANFQDTAQATDWTAFKNGLRQSYIGADPEIRAMQILVSINLGKCKQNLSAYIARFQKALTELGNNSPNEKFKCFLFIEGLDLELKAATACDPQTGKPFENLEALIRAAQNYQQVRAQTSSPSQESYKEVANKKRPASQFPQPTKRLAPKPPLSANSQPQKHSNHPSASPAKLKHPADKYVPRGQPGFGLRTPQEFQEIKDKGLCSVCLQPGHVKNSPLCSYIR